MTHQGWVHLLGLLKGMQPFWCGACSLGGLEKACLAEERRKGTDDRNGMAWAQAHLLVPTGRASLSLLLMRRSQQNIAMECAVSTQDKVMVGVICRHVGLLVVHVASARDLKKMDAIGKSDPFVELYTQPTDVVKTVKPPRCE